METTAGADAPNAGAALRAAMAVTAFGPGGDDVTLARLRQQPMMFQDAEVETQDRVGALGTAIDDAVDHGLRPECAKTLRDIVFLTHLDFFRRAMSGDPPLRVEPMTVRLQPGARAVRASGKYTYALLAGSDKFPTKKVARGLQAAAAAGGPTRDTALGAASLDSEGLNRVEHHSHCVIWVPAGADSLKK